MKTALTVTVELDGKNSEEILDAIDFLKSLLSKPYPDDVKWKDSISLGAPLGVQTKGNTSDRTLGFGKKVDEAREEEEKHDAEKIKEIVTEKKKNDDGEKRWSTMYDKCIHCGSAEHRYMGKGLCSHCYFKYRDYPNGAIQ